MDQDVADAIANIKKRLKRQEEAHSNIVETETGGEDKDTKVGHGIVTAIPIIITCILLSAFVAYSVANFYNRRIA